MIRRQILRACAHSKPSSASSSLWRTTNRHKFRQPDSLIFRNARCVHRLHVQVSDLCCMTSLRHPDDGQPMLLPPAPTSMPTNAATACRSKRFQQCSKKLVVLLTYQGAHLTSQFYPQMPCPGSITRRPAHPAPILASQPYCPVHILGRAVEHLPTVRDSTLPPGRSRPPYRCALHHHSRRKHRLRLGRRAAEVDPKAP
jgi:hypothetical protein